MIALTLLLVGLVGILAALVRTVRADGYGHRPSPRSHVHEIDTRWTVGR